MQISSQDFCKLMSGRYEASLGQLYEAARECGVDPSQITIGALVGQPSLPVPDVPRPNREVRTRPAKPQDPSPGHPRPRLRRSLLENEVARTSPKGFVLYTRSPRDRALLDEIVMQSLMRAGEWTNVELLDVYGKRGLKTVMGLKSPITTKQLRESLRRLHARKLIERKGQARGTQYRFKTKK